MPEACSPRPHTRSPARIENDCSHAGPRLAGTDSLRSTTPPGPAVRSAPSGNTVTSSIWPRIIQAPSGRKTSKGWMWTSGAGPGGSPSMAYGTGWGPGPHDVRTTSSARKATSSWARSKWNSAAPGPGFHTSTFSSRPGVTATASERDAASGQA